MHGSRKKARFYNRFVSRSHLLGRTWFPFLHERPHTSGVCGNDGCRGPVMIWPSRLGWVQIHVCVKRSCRRVFGSRAGCRAAINTLLKGSSSVHDEIQKPHSLLIDTKYIPLSFDRGTGSTQKTELSVGFRGSDPIVMPDTIRTKSRSYMSRAIRLPWRFRVVPLDSGVPTPPRPAWVSHPGCSKPVFQTHKW